ncbi:MAG: hypothetical protein K9G46_16085 [Flavobacteriales bacterium]|nr:hypothetical protein [Flavobacteriales bacterium]
MGGYHANGILPVFIPVKAIAKLLLSLIFTIGLATMAVADIGETFDLKQKRTQLQSELEQLKNDSTSSFTQIVDVSNHIIRLDQQIFDSYNETVDRLSNNQLKSNAQDQGLVWLALITTLISIFFAILLAMARGRVIDKGGFGLLDVYKQLSQDFFQKVSPEKAGSQRMLRINVVIILGMVCMSISILGFLISKF